jgi:hypothetical protein
MNRCNKCRGSVERVSEERENALEETEKYLVLEKQFTLCFGYLYMKGLQESS